MQFEKINNQFRIANQKNQNEIEMNFETTFVKSCENQKKSKWSILLYFTNFLKNNNFFYFEINNQFRIAIQKNKLQFEMNFY